MKKSEYIFKSERLGFRNLRNEDLEEFAKLNSDEEVMEHFPKILSKKEVEKFIEKLRNHYAKNGYTYYATEILETKEFIGMIGLAFQEYKTNFTPAIDIGWRLKRNAWGKGYATEALAETVDFIFNELNKRRIVTSIDPRNIKSIELMQRLGFRKEAHFIESILIDGVWVDDIVYAVLKDEWMERK